MHRSNMKTALKVTAYATAAVGLLALSQSVFAADDLTAIVSRVESNVKPIATLLSTISYVAGVGFAIAGIVQFKAHKDNPQQVPLSKPLVYIGVAAGLLFLPTIIDTAGQTVFGGTGGRADEGIK